MLNWALPNICVSQRLHWSYPYGEKILSFSLLNTPIAIRQLRSLSVLWRICHSSSCTAEHKVLGSGSFSTEHSWTSWAESMRSITLLLMPSSFPRGKCEVYPCEEKDFFLGSTLTNSHCVGFPVLVNNSYILLLRKHLCASIPHISHFTSFAWVLWGPTALLKCRSKFLQPLSSTLTISAMGALESGPTRCIYLLQNSSLWALSWHTWPSTSSFYHCALILMSPQIFTCCHSPLHSQTKSHFVITVRNSFGQDILFVC